MLPEEFWESLGLDREEVRRRADFFAAYSGLAASPPEPTAVDLAELSRGSELPEGPGLAAFGEVPRSETDRLVEVQGSRRRPLWVQLGDQADALREAAIATLLLEVPRGLATLNSAGSAYAEAGIPYGTFLQGLTERGEDLSWRALELLGSPADDEAHRVSPAALRVPNQQLYLCLIFAASRAASQEARHLVKERVAGPQERSAAPFGTSGRTLSEWWSLVHVLIDYEDSPRCRDRLWELLVRFGVAHGGQLERARLDDHHWKRLRASVDLIDLDLAGATCIAARRLEQHGEELGAADIENLPPLARLSITVGIQMAEEEKGLEPVGL